MLYFFLFESKYLLMTACGYGKIILFGEHFVVYGVPAIASALELKVEAEIVPEEKGIAADDLLTGRKVFYRRDEAPIIDLMPIFLKQFNLSEKERFYIKLRSNVPRYGGLGSSAALVVAVARAMSDYFKRGFDDYKINEIAYEAEKYFHRTPSGVDNTVATFGGVLWFEKNMEGGPNRIERLKFKKPVEVVIGNTGITRDTGEVVQGVRNRKEKNPEKYEKIFSEVKKLVHNSRDALLENDLPRVGRLMDENHQLLRKIEVSCGELDTLCETALSSGAFGAKLTGGGMGGFMIALTPGNSLQEKVAGAIEKEGFATLKTKIGV